MHSGKQSQHKQDVCLYLDPMGIIIAELREWQGLFMENIDSNKNLKYFQPRPLPIFWLIALDSTSSLELFR